MTKNNYNSYQIRRSFHKFPENDLFITEEEIKELRQYINTLPSLTEENHYTYRIVSAKEISHPVKAEYYISFYADSGKASVENVGYIIEQIELHLIRKEIGVLIYGMGKETEKKVDGMDFVIMMAIAKVSKSDFRYDRTSAKRRSLKDIWNGSRYLDVAQEVRYCPSSINSQPWLTEENGNVLSVYRTDSLSFFKIVTKNLIRMNRVDMGIYLAVLETVLEEKGYGFKRTMVMEMSGSKELVAEYEILEEVKQ